MNGHDPYNFVYVGLPKAHHVLKKCRTIFIVAQRGLKVKALHFVVRTDGLIYLYQKCQMSSIDCSQVKLIWIQSILEALIPKKDNP
jgi:hypothetical protein